MSVFKIIVPVIFAVKCKETKLPLRLFIEVGYSKINVDRIGQIFGYNISEDEVSLEETSFLKIVSVNKSS